MALPVHHPFWLTLLLTVAVAALSAALVHARADRIVSPATAAGFDRGKLRRTAAGGIAGAAILFGGVASGLFLVLEAWGPDLAGHVFRIGSSIAAIALSLAAVRLRANARMRGVPELVALNVLWAAGFGWLLPSIVEREVEEDPSPGPVPIERTTNTEPRSVPTPCNRSSGHRTMTGSFCATEGSVRARCAFLDRMPAACSGPSSLAGFGPPGFGQAPTAAKRGTRNNCRKRGCAEGDRPDWNQSRVSGDAPGCGGGSR
jgi:hypothetical protein